MNAIHTKPILLKSCRFIVTQNPQREILANYNILISEKKIQKITNEPIDNLGEETLILNCENKIIIPGLINCHTHIGMHKQRGLSDDKSLHEWLEEVIAEEKKQTNEEMVYYADLAVKEMLSTGTTCFNEMYGKLHPVIQGVNKNKIRSIQSLSIFDKFSPPVEKFDLSDLFALESDLLKIAIAPHSVYGCNVQTLEKVTHYAKEHNLIKNIHIDETKKEVVDCVEKVGKSPMEILDEIQFIDEKTNLIHSVHFTEKELLIAKERKANLVHCPTSNLKLASGIMPLNIAWDLGLNVALGTDSVASNNCMDMFYEMKLCAIMHKNHHQKPEATTAQKVLDMATVCGAKCLGMETQIGSIEVGKFADLALIDANTFRFQPCLKERIVSHLVYAASGHNVQDVIVNGELVYHNRIFI